MEPRPPNPITAAENLRKIPDHLQRLSSAFLKANQEGSYFLTGDSIRSSLSYGMWAYMPTI